MTEGKGSGVMYAKGLTDVEFIQDCRGIRDRVTARRGRRRGRSITHFLHPSTNLSYCIFSSFTRADEELEDQMEKGREVERNVKNIERERERG